MLQTAFNMQCSVTILHAVDKMKTEFLTETVQTTIDYRKHRHVPISIDGAGKTFLVIY